MWLIRTLDWKMFRLYDQSFDKTHTNHTFAYINLITLRVIPKKNKKGKKWLLGHPVLHAIKMTNTVQPSGGAKHHNKFLWSISSSSGQIQLLASFTLHRKWEHNLFYRIHKEQAEMHFHWGKFYSNFQIVRNTPLKFIRLVENALK